MRFRRGAWGSRHACFNDCQRPAEIAASRTNTMGRSVGNAGRGHSVMNDVPHDFLDTLFADCKGFLELRAISPGKGPAKRSFFDIRNKDAMNGFIHKYRDRHLYYATATRNGRSGRAVDIVNIPVLFCRRGQQERQGRQRQGAQRLFLKTVNSNRFGGPEYIRSGSSMNRQPLKIRRVLQLS